ncbi:amidohydrolase family protein [Paenibacillus sp. LMG 31461]|uniref:Amidohydrolase family protein n=1 Tax=Paenibacillus plantarum TaxID=2654975 RepID=A0ABX1XIL8_9BACL|nr:amidohydrolase family protein [Paenibacillus plantarum]NOU67699.1 amidohydrolase family protein [Paenibacillus plantarum]
MSNPITIKGLMNYHAHIDKGGIVPPFVYRDAPASERAAWTREAKASFTVEDIKARASAIIENMIRYGTVYLRTHVDVDPIVGLKGMEAILELREIYKDRIAIDAVAFAQEGFDRFPESEGLLHEALRMGAHGIGGHTTMDQDGKQHITKIFEIAEAENAEFIEFHTDETGKEEHFLQPFLAEHTIQRGWQGRVTAIHCSSLANVSEAAAQLAAKLTAKADVKVTICPTAIATRSLTRVKMLLQEGVQIRLGSDNIGDFFNPFGSGNMLHYAQMLAYILRFYEPKEVETIMDALISQPVEGRLHTALSSYDFTYKYKASSIYELLTHAEAPERCREILTSPDLLARR